MDESAETPNELPLEKLEEQPSEGSIASVEFQEESRNDYGVDWQKYIEDAENTEIKASSNSYSNDEETSFENFVSKKTTLREHLTHQLSEVELDELCIYFVTLYKSWYSSCVNWISFLI